MGDSPREIREDALGVPDEAEPEPPGDTERDGGDAPEDPTVEADRRDPTTAGPGDSEGGSPGGAEPALEPDDD